MTLTEDHIREVVRHTVPEVLAAYGVDTAEPHEAQADMAYLRRRRQFDEKFTLRARLIVVTVLISSAITGILFLFKEAFNIGT